MQIRDSTREHIGSAPISVRVAAHTDVGLVRKRNEDSILLADIAFGERSAHQLHEIGAAGILLGVCDGMGGQAAGDVASRMAVEVVIEQMKTAAPFPDADAFARGLVDAIRAASIAIHQHARKHPAQEGMGTTCTVAAITPTGTLFVGQVGDSRAYLFRNGILVQITKDQSLVNQLVESGYISAEDARHSRASNIILQALGGANELNVDLTRIDVRGGDKLLLCSDGLSGPIQADAIAHVLTESEDLAASCERLVALANAAGGPDNITAVLCEFDGTGLVAPSIDDHAEYRPYALQSRPASAALLAARLSKSRTSNPDSEPEVAPDAKRRAWQWTSAAVLILLFAASAWWRVTRAEQPAAPSNTTPAAPLAEQATATDTPAHVTTTAKTVVERGTIQAQEPAQELLKVTSRPRPPRPNPQSKHASKTPPDSTEGQADWDMPTVETEAASPFR